MSSARAARRIAAAAAMLTILSFSAARADTYHFKDALRPHGHERGMAAKYADGRACGASAGHRFSNVPSFKQCMRAHGWVVDRYTPDRSRSRVAARPARVTGARSSSRYIDPDTGMSCQNFGGVAVCDPPQGTVRYFDPEQGLNCQRTGIVAICSNF